MNSKDRCLAVIEGRAVDRVPVFPLLMFLAARHSGIDYRTYATDGLAMADSQVNMYRKFGVDAITACSDAFRISADLGGDMCYPEMAPPHLEKPLVRGISDLKNLVRPDPCRNGCRMADRTRAVREMVKAVGDECLVLGWIDMPFAEACSLCGVTEFMMLIMDDPPVAHAVLEFLTLIDVDFAVSQVEAGAHMIGAGDAAASLISPELYREFALPYEKRVAEAIHNAGALVKLHICGNTSALLDDMVKSDCDLFNVDHMVDLAHAAEVYGEAGKCFKGNLNPVTDMLRTTPDQCVKRAEECIRIAGRKRFMLSPGCEVPTGVTDEVFTAFCQVKNVKSI